MKKHIFTTLRNIDLRQNYEYIMIRNITFAMQNYILLFNGYIGSNRSNFIYTVGFSNTSRIRTLPTSKNF